MFTYHQLPRPVHVDGAARVILSNGNISQSVRFTCKERGEDGDEISSEGEEEKCWVSDEWERRKEGEKKKEKKKKKKSTQ